MPLYRVELSKCETTYYSATVTVRADDEKEAKRKARDADADWSGPCTSDDDDVEVVEIDRLGDGGRLVELLAKLDACQDSMTWAIEEDFGDDLKKAWDAADDPDWLSWLFDRMDLEDEDYRARLRDERKRVLESVGPRDYLYRNELVECKKAAMTFERVERKALQILGEIPEDAPDDNEPAPLGVPCGVCGKTLTVDGEHFYCTFRGHTRSLCETCECPQCAAEKKADEPTAKEEVSGAGPQAEG